MIIKFSKKHERFSRTFPKKEKLFWNEDFISLNLKEEASQQAPFFLSEMPVVWKSLGGCVQVSETSYFIKIYSMCFPSSPAPKQFHIVIEAAEKTEKSISGQPFFRYRKTRRFLLDFLEKSEQNSFHFQKIILVMRFDLAFSIETNNKQRCFFF